MKKICMALLLACTLILLQAEERKASSIGEKINEAIAINVVFTVNLGFYEMPITDTVISTWIIMAILVGASLLATRNLKEVPGRGQAAVEGFVEFINKFAKDNIGHHSKPYAPFIGTVALFLAVANCVSLLSPVGGFGFEPLFEIKPPTRDINITAAFAVSTITSVIFSRFRYKGPLGFLKSLFKPVAFMLPFNLLEYIVRPLSLCLRLFGNILGAFIIMRLLEALVPVLIPPIFGLYFDLFDGMLQTIVFVFLSTIFIAEAVE